MASDHITSWQIGGETVETVRDFILGGSKITADGNCSHPWKKSYGQPRQHFKSRDITLPTKVHLVKAMIFPVVVYGYENWTIKKAESQRIDAFFFFNLFIYFLIFYFFLNFKIFNSYMRSQT